MSFLNKSNGSVNVINVIPTTQRSTSVFRKQFLSYKDKYNYNTELQNVNELTCLKARKLYSFVEFVK